MPQVTTGLLRLRGCPAGFGDCYAPVLPDTRTRAALPWPSLPGWRLCPGINPPPAYAKQHRQLLHGYSRKPYRPHRRELTPPPSQCHRPVAEEAGAGGGACVKAVSRRCHPAAATVPPPCHLTDVVPPPHGPPQMVRRRQRRLRRPSGSLCSKTHSNREHVAS